MIPNARAPSAINPLTTLFAGLAIMAAGVAGLALSRSGAVARPPAVPVPAPRGPAAGVPWPSDAGRVAPPVRLIIPAIGLRTRLIRLGLGPDGTLQVPRSVSVAGWYDRSPRPGATGSAIIAGHIDSVAGPAVFFWLHSLRAGDRVYVRRADGTLAVFRVTAVRSYRKNRFPTLAVYGPSPGPQLRLITCGGVFDRALGSYLSNVVVYAVAVGPRAAPPRLGRPGQHNGERRRHHRSHRPRRHPLGTVASCPPVGCFG